MAKVFVVNFSGHDYTQAEQFGELIFMTKGVLNLNKTRPYVEKMDSFIRDAKEDDFLLFSSSSLISALALSTWFKYHPKCKVLLFDWPKKYKLYDIER